MEILILGKKITSLAPSLSIFLFGNRSRPSPERVVAPERVVSC